MTQDLIEYINEARSQLDQADETKQHKDPASLAMWERQKAVILGQIAFAQAVVTQAELDERQQLRRES